MQRIYNYSSTHSVGVASFWSLLVGNKHKEVASCAVSGSFFLSFLPSFLPANGITKLDPRKERWRQISDVARQKGTEKRLRKRKKAFEVTERKSAEKAQKKRGRRLPTGTGQKRERERLDGRKEKEKGGKRGDDVRFSYFVGQIRNFITKKVCVV